MQLLNAFLLISLSVHVAWPEETEGYFFRVPGKRFAFESLVQLVLHQASLMDCAAECLKEGIACNSFNFVGLTNDFALCNLQTRLTTNRSMLLNEEGSIYACKYMNYMYS